MSLRVGVVAFQGAWKEHVRALRSCGAEAVPLRQAPAEPLDGVVLPGGESTVIGRLGESSGLFSWIRRERDRGMPLLGTCAGAILLADRIEGVPPPGCVGGFPVIAHRNAFGRQKESFDAPLIWRDGSPFPGVFIRAPRFSNPAPEVEVLARHGEEAVGLRHGAHFVVAFHPELTTDRRLHELFLQACGERWGR